MNQYADLGQDVSVWETEQPSRLIADMSFTPISVTNIEMTDDYEPVAYQANRALMQANAAQEINELQERNHAMTAYSTLDCQATPLFPTFNAQRATDCVLRKKYPMPITGGVPLSKLVTQPSPPLGYKPELIMGAKGFPAQGGQTPVVVPSVVPQPVAQSDLIHLDPAEQNLTQSKRVRLQKQRMAKKGHSQRREHGDKDDASLMAKLSNSVRGAFYDLAHYNELPPKLEGESTGTVLAYAVTREDRLGYLMLYFAIFVLFLTLIGVAVRLGMKNAKK